MALYSQGSEEASLPFGSIEESEGGCASISLQSVSIRGDVRGLLFSSVIRQQYRNRSEKNLEIIYTFPLARGTALLGMSATIGTKELMARVVEKKEAEEVYETAISAGDSAIMVQRSARGLYTANLGNIAAGEEVLVELRCARLLRFEKDRVRLSIPTVIGERFGDEHMDGGLAAHETAQASAAASYAFSLEIALHGEIARGKVSCPSHDLVSEEIEDGLVFRLRVGAFLNRDFVLLMEGVTGLSLAQYVTFRGKTLVCAAFAPECKSSLALPLALKILVDCSGSMQGARIAQARQGLSLILDSLSEKDRVSFSRFGSVVVRLSSEVLCCDEKTRSRLAEEVASIEANLGGTQLEEALCDTFDIQTPEDLPCAVLCITDGDVWEVESVLSRARASGQRVFAIGVGSAPSESLLQELAEQTGGACEIVTQNEDMSRAVVRMFERMRAAAVRSVHVSWDCEPVWQSKSPRYLYSGETVHAFALTPQLPQHPPLLHYTVDGVEQTAVADHFEENICEDLFRLGMQRRMEEEEDEKERLEIALSYQLVSELTSLVLVCQREEGEKFENLPSIQQVPQMIEVDRAFAVSRQCFSAGMRATCAPGEDICPCDLDEDDGAEEEKVRLEEKGKTPTLPKIEERLVSALIFFFGSRILRYPSVASCMAKAAEHEELEAGQVIVNGLCAEFGLDQNVVWAIFLTWASERSQNGAVLTRHGLRSIDAALSRTGVDLIEQVRKRLDELAA